MSRDAIAEVLGRLDYGDHADEVDWRDRLREVDGLLAAGVVVDVEELITGGAGDLWHDLRRVLHPLGWRVILGRQRAVPRVGPAPRDPAPRRGPPHAVRRGRRVRRRHRQHHLQPAGPPGGQASLHIDDDWITHHEPTADALLTWLATP